MMVCDSPGLEAKGAMAKTTMVTKCTARFAALAAALLLAGCGPFMVVRQGSKVFGEISERNQSLAKQKEAAWAQLWPELQHRCQEAAVERPPGTVARRASVVFDSTDEELTVPPGVTGQLDLAKARWSALKYEHPADADYLVFWDRRILRSEPLLTLEEHTLRIDDRAGRTVGTDTQFALHWQGAVRPEYLRCARMPAEPGPRPPVAKAPDFGLLFELFGRRG